MKTGLLTVPLQRKLSLEIQNLQIENLFKIFVIYSSSIHTEPLKPGRQKFFQGAGSGFVVYIAELFANIFEKELGGGTSSFLQLESYRLEQIAAIFSTAGAHWLDRFCSQSQKAHTKRQQWDSQHYSQKNKLSSVDYNKLKETLH